MCWFGLYNNVTYAYTNVVIYCTVIYGILYVYVKLIITFTSNNIKQNYLQYLGKKNCSVQLYYRDPCS